MLSHFHSKATVKSPENVSVSLLNNPSLINGKVNQTVDFVRNLNVPVLDVDFLRNLNQIGLDAPVQIDVPALDINSPYPIVNIPTLSTYQITVHDESIPELVPVVVPNVTLSKNLEDKILKKKVNRTANCNPKPIIRPRIIRNENSRIRTEQPFPAELIGFGFDKKQYLILENEFKDDNTNGEREQIVVATGIRFTDELGNPTFYQKLDLLSATNLRILAKSFGCKNLGSKSKFCIRFAMAQKKSLGIRYLQNTVTNCNGAELNTKNYIRVINAVFHPDNYESFMLINDRKSRDDFETGNGSRNCVFYNNIANYYNDLMNHDLDYFLDPTDKEDDNFEQYIKEAIEDNHNPINCVQLNGLNVKAMITSLIKIRGSMIANMKQSGENEHDPMRYTQAAIKRQSYTKSVSRFSAYYFYMACLEHKEMDNMLKRYLHVSMKCNSSTPLPDNNSVSIINKAKVQKMCNLTDKLSQITDRIGEQISSTKTLESTNEYYKIINLLEQHKLTLLPGMELYEELMEKKLELRKYVFPSKYIDDKPLEIDLNTKKRKFIDYDYINGADKSISTNDINVEDNEEQSVVDSVITNITTEANEFMALVQKQHAIQENKLKNCLLSISSNSNTNTNTTKTNTISTNQNDLKSKHTLNDTTNINQNTTTPTNMLCTINDLYLNTTSTFASSINSTTLKKNGKETIHMNNDKMEEDIELVDENVYVNNKLIGIKKFLVRTEPIDIERIFRNEDNRMFADFVKDEESNNDDDSIYMYEKIQKKLD